jgi:hypothetical protein
MMIIPIDTKLQVLYIDLELLENGVTEGLIEMDPETYDMMMEYLLEEQRFEDMCLFRDNKEYLVS